MALKWIGDFGYDENGKLGGVKFQRGEAPSQIDPTHWHEAFKGLVPLPTRYQQLRRAAEDKAKAAGIDPNREYK